MASVLDIFRALADPTRIRIVQLLRSMELSVGEIAQVIGQSQPRASRHIRILADADIIERRKEGSWVFLRLSDGQQIPPLLACLDAAPANDSEMLWVKADLARLAAVRNDRTLAAEAFFAEHADEWDAIRSLHVPEADVEAMMRAMLGDEAGQLRVDRLLDIGTGTGRMLELFGPAARSVVAVDRSPDMLRLARAKQPGEGAEKYALLQGDFYALPVADDSVDTVLLHQVLHYAQAPEAVLAEAARVMDRDGRLLIVDFAPHQQEELRTRDQHARLGFSDEQIGQWTQSAGLDLERVEAMPGGALTVKLWLARKRAGCVVSLGGRASA